MDGYCKLLATQGLPLPSGYNREGVVGIGAQAVNGTAVSCDIGVAAIPLDMYR